MLLATSPHTLSDDRYESSFDIEILLSAFSKLSLRINSGNCALNLATLSALSGSSKNASETGLKYLFSISFMPLNGQ